MSYWVIIPLFCRISGRSAWFRGCTVHGFELGVQGAWFREYGVPGFQSESIA